MPEQVKIGEDLQKALIDVVKLCEQEDREIRKSMVRQWKKNEEFWHGVQYLFWSTRDDSWRSPADVGWEDSNDDNDNIQEQLGSFEDKVIDIFRGHGESIIAALSSQLPSIRFMPDDADNTNDLLTARTYSRIADLVQRHNHAKMVFFRSLFFLCIQGLVASYRYKESDYKYGSYKVPIYGEEKKESEKLVCADCGYELQEGELPDVNSEKSQPFEYDSSSDNPKSCPQCGSVEKPKKVKEIQSIPQQTGEEDFPKSRAKLDVFGPLNFKIPYHARSQEECSYFILYADQGKDILKYTYRDHAEEIEQEHLDSNERFSRSSYTGSESEDDQRHLVLIKKVWLRPASFFKHPVIEKAEKLEKKFPKGCRVILIGKKNIFIDSSDETLDDRWVIGKAGLSTYIHSDPILRPLVQIQEMRNQLVNLIIETINHGIPSEFADSEVINFDIYGRFEAVPGYLYKAKPRRAGEPLSDGFYTSSRATLSREVAVFLKQLDQDAQFSVGSFPSIYGGASEGKSRTFAEYSMSRQMALQRLSITWNFVSEWWCKTIEGLVKLYKECVTEDEKYVTYENGNYINVWIRMCEMQGKVGGVEPESSDTFPATQAQIKELILKLMELNNEYVNTVLYNPANAKVIQDCFALNELKIPGEAQRVKQAGEIQQLIQSGPLSEIQSSVPIDIDVDDHAVHIAVLIQFLVEQIGLDEKRMNPPGYANCVAHLKEHKMAMMAATAAASPTPAGAPEPTNAGEEQE